MLEITLKGYAPRHESEEDVKKGPEIIFKKVQWPVVPRIGEKVFCSNDTSQEIDEIWHDMEKGHIEVHFTAYDRTVLKDYVDNDGFTVE